MFGASLVPLPRWRFGLVGVGGGARMPLLCRVPRCIQGTLDEHVGSRAGERHRMCRRDRRVALAEDVGVDRGPVDEDGQL